MSETLTFSSRLAYDPAHPSITIPTRLRLGSTTVGAGAKLDTGASCCVFARELGEDLGLDIEAGEQLRIGTVTGSFTTFGHAVTLEAGGVELDTTVYFAAEHGFPRNVLGRRGFADRLRLGIVDYDGLLNVGRYDHQS